MCAVGLCRHPIFPDGSWLYEDSKGLALYLSVCVRVSVCVWPPKSRDATSLRTSRGDGVQNQYPSRGMCEGCGADKGRDRIEARRRLEVCHSRFVYKVVVGDIKWGEDADGQLLGGTDLRGCVAGKFSMGEV